ncbi:MULTISPECIES: TetR/AcrR family transcriptional regulator [Staphylococcus]|uniref:TetR family transcriptional regulator n=1 Tax=Staphylococcus agnetis TaxID=985762 RepID=A0A2T4MH00_9STAP|nr:MULTISPECIES: TetR/AcrR family transcriptional regulator [Staphylococcus]MBY7664349.1 TetR/AcrR family transcriptional regulator [Staphylococcus agnetis]MCO4325700.1 TetR/AcrR family transcriptional regulator [Staphylococcus agnetis]MCO4356535.1 TetR/AcrR family transcriptional regulator [Staphylococcus agnetis]MCO4362786.1 TetR/AcrR family transcriptional regulator [Staphylococcus agnetis]MCO4369876.1 TetR/AcrR family transcriptional regulator [Staphylococcus agnetis]
MAQTHKKRRDARENKALILETVLALSQQGVNIVDMKMADIAKASGVGVGTLYRHYENKAVLCIALLDAQAEDMFKEMDTFLEAHNDASTYERLEGLLRIYVTLKESHFQTLSFIEKSMNRTISMVEIPFYHELAVRINAQFDMPPDDYFITHILLHCFSSDFYFYAKNKKAFTQEDYIHKVLDIILS